MITLVPTWAHHYDAFWDAIKRRNNWFIKLRYGAILMLVAFLLSVELILHAAYTGLQIRVFIILVLAILAYNISFQKISKNLKCIPGKFNPLHLSLVQMLFLILSASLKAPSPAVSGRIIANSSPPYLPTTSSDLT